MGQTVDLESATEDPDSSYGESLRVRGKITNPLLSNSRCGSFWNVEIVKLGASPVPPRRSQELCRAEANLNRYNNAQSGRICICVALCFYLMFCAALLCFCARRVTDSASCVV